MPHSDTQSQDWMTFLKTADEGPRTARLFRNGRNQAVRLPQDMALGDASEVLIYRIGDRLVIEPKRPPWTGMVDAPPADEDFLIERPALGIDPEDRKA